MHFRRSVGHERTYASAAENDGTSACSLSPVLGGEGRGEGLGARGVEEPIAREDASSHPRFSDATRRSPLSPTLSPAYREEGAGARPLAHPRNPECPKMSEN